MLAPKVEYRKTNNKTYTTLINHGYSALESLLIANRVSNEEQALNIKNKSLNIIEAPSILKNADRAADRIADAIEKQEEIGVVSDHDVDGITGNSVIQHSLTTYFNHPPKQLISLIGHKANDGYGISDGLLDKLFIGVDTKKIILPSLIISVDCGSSDEDRIAKLKKRGVDVIITDHHKIPKQGVPASAYTVVNPQQNGCAYLDKSIAGVTVAWLVMTLTRFKLIKRGYLTKSSPNLNGLLDFVSLGTVADAVSIASLTNRAIVDYGLRIINANIRSCWKVIRSDVNQGMDFKEQDLGFKIGPRINARSRMSDPYAASHYLLANNEQTARKYLTWLEKDNEERKKVERKMTVIAKSMLNQSELTYGVVIYHDEFFAGVQGIVSSRISEYTGKPSVIFSPSRVFDEVTGSGRTVSGVLLDTVFELIEQRSPGIHIKVGGHKGAFGCTIKKNNIPKYRELFSTAIKEQIDKAKLKPTIIADCEWIPAFGELNNALQTLSELAPFGREFESPIFIADFIVKKFSLMGTPKIHGRFTLYSETERRTYQGVQFNMLENELDDADVQIGSTITVTIEISENNFRGNISTQLQIKNIAHNPPKNSIVFCP